MRKSLFLLTASLLMSLAAIAAEVTLKQLPQRAQEFIHQYFAKDQIQTIHQHHHRHGNSYRVLFKDGSKINFDASGQWTKIKLRNDSIPVEIIPEYITTYVWDAYPDVMIMSIETEGQGQEVELSDGTELTFNPKGNVVKIE
ncbi:MAG: PepSY-like domain-containing protein [Tidjanibacter sp.]|nr:PepSY-like domain-containing protein [Tidjanibacter sp.]